MGRTEPGPFGIDELLLVDPPVDVSQRFQLPERSAVVFTGARVETGLATVERVHAGDAHLRFGERLVDIHHHAHSTLVLLPEMGILCCGAFGSDVVPPQVAPTSDGSEELDVLRHAARLVRDPGVQLLIPRFGSIVSGRARAMERLAEDVAYLHALRRTLSPMVQRANGVHDLSTVAATLLPAGWRTEYGRELHAANVRALLGVAD